MTDQEQTEFYQAASGIAVELSRVSTNWDIAKGSELAEDIDHLRDRCADLAAALLPELQKKPTGLRARWRHWWRLGVSEHEQMELCEEASDIAMELSDLPLNEGG